MLLNYLVKNLMMLISFLIINRNFGHLFFSVIEGSHNIGIAMATAYGLVVPNIKKVQSLSILEVSSNLNFMLYFVFCFIVFLISL